MYIVIILNRDVESIADGFQTEAEAIDYAGKILYSNDSVSIYKRVYDTNKILVKDTEE
jgi:hypothetical protein